MNFQVLTTVFDKGTVFF